MESTTEKPTLEDMPKLAMNQILGELEMKSILSLRKVSTGLHEFINDTKPDFKLCAIKIDITFDKVQLVITTCDDPTPITIVYQKTENGCLVVAGFRDICMKNKDFMEKFLEDLDRTLKHQKSTLEEFQLASDSIPGDVKTMFNTRSPPFKTKKLILKTTVPSDFMQILPHVCPVALKELGLHNNSGTTLRHPLNMAEIMSLPHWKMTESMDICGFQVEVPVRELLHFTGVNISVTTVSAKDLLFLKETFLLRDDFKYFFINYEFLTNKSSINRLFGFPHLTGTTNKGTFFNIPTSNKYLLYVFYSATYAQFSVLNVFDFSNRT